jgi:hypothetical protein
MELIMNTPEKRQEKVAVRYESFAKKKKEKILITPGDSSKAKYCHPAK